MDTVQLVKIYQTQLQNLKRDNQALRIKKAQNQERIDLLKSQIATETRALEKEQKRYNAKLDDFEIKKEMNPVHLPPIYEDEEASLVLEDEKLEADNVIVNEAAKVSSL